MSMSIEYKEWAGDQMAPGELLTEREVTEMPPLSEMLGAMTTFVGRLNLIHGLPPELLSRWRASLPERSRFVVERLYGFDRHPYLSLRQIGRMLEGVAYKSGRPGESVTTERVRQIEAKAVRALVRMIKDEGWSWND
jgi:hypothetical protein